MLRDTGSETLSKGKEQLKLLRAKRDELDATIAQFAGNIAKLQEPFDASLVDRDRLRAILRDTAAMTN